MDDLIYNLRRPGTDMLHRSAADELDRLALAREWIAGCDHKGHHKWCATRRFGSFGNACTCGRDALLKKLEVPRG